MFERDSAKKFFIEIDYAICGELLRNGASGTRNPRLQIITLTIFVRTESNIREQIPTRDAGITDQLYLPTNFRRFTSPEVVSFYAPC